MKKISTMIVCWRFLTILFVIGLVGENNAGFAKNVDDFLPSTTSKNLQPDADLKDDLQPPKGLQVAKNLGLARLKFMKNAKNLKLRLANKRNGMKGLLPPHHNSLRGRLAKNNQGFKKNEEDTNNKNLNNNFDFDENMEATDNNYFFQSPYMVGDDINNNNNYKNHLSSSTVREYLPDNENNGNNDDEDDDESIHLNRLHYQKNSKRWWENQDTTSHVDNTNNSPNHHNHYSHNNNNNNNNLNRMKDDDITSISNAAQVVNQFNDQNNFEGFAESNLQQAKISNGNNNDALYDEILRNNMEFEHEERLRKERQNKNQMSEWIQSKIFSNSDALKDETNHKMKYHVEEANNGFEDEKMQRMKLENFENSDTIRYRAPHEVRNYNFQNAEPFVWYTFDQPKPYALNFDYREYKTPQQLNDQGITSHNRNDFSNMELPKILQSVKNDEISKKKMNVKNEKQKTTDSDNMEHLKHENENIHPVIMDEYIQAVRGHRHIPMSNTQNSNNPIRIQIFDSKSNPLLNKNFLNEESQQNFVQENQNNLQIESSSPKSDTADDFFTKINLAEAISKAEKKISKIEEELEKKQSNQLHIEENKDNKMNKNVEDNKNDEKNHKDQHKMESTNMKAVMMAVHARELQKRRIENGQDLNIVNHQDPILQRYLSTDASNELNYKYLLKKTGKIKEDNRMADGNDKLKWQKIMQQNKNDATGHASENSFSSQQQINIPTIHHSGYTVFEPTRIVHYRFADDKIPVFDEPQTIINVNTANIETQKTLDSPTLLSRMFDPSRMYAMQFGYQENNPQIPVTIYQPTYRWPIINPQPITYTYEGVQYKFPREMVETPPPSSNTDPILTSLGPQIPGHLRTFTPGNLFGLTRYNSGYGGPLKRLQYYQALVNKRILGSQHRDHDSEFDNESYASENKETLAKRERRNTKDSDEGHYLTKRNTNYAAKSHVTHHRYKRNAPASPSTPAATCPCFKYPYYGFYQQSPALPYNPESRLAFRRSIRRKRESESALDKKENEKNEKNEENEENEGIRKQRHIDRQSYVFPDCGNGQFSKFGVDYSINRKDRLNPYPEPDPSQDPSYYNLDQYQDAYRQINSYGPNRDMQLVHGNQPIKEITLKSNDDPNEILKTIQQHNEQAIRDALSKAGSEPLQIGGGSIGSSIVLNEDDIKGGGQQQIYDTGNTSPLNLQADQSSINGFAVQSPPIQSEFVRNYQPEILPVHSQHYAALNKRHYQEFEAPRNYLPFRSQTSLRISNPFLPQSHESMNHRSIPQNYFPCYRPQQMSPLPPPAPLPALSQPALTTNPSPSTASCPLSSGYQNVSPTDIYARNFVHPVFAYNPKTTVEPTLDPLKFFNLPDATGDSFKQLLEAIKTKLLACCEKCKKKILKGIHEKIDDDEPECDVPSTAETTTTSSYEESYPTPACTNCKTAKNIYSEVENLSRDIWNDEIEIRRRSSSKSSKKAALINDKKNKLRKLVHHLAELRKLSCEDSSQECRNCVSSERTPYTIYSTEQTSLEFPSSRRSQSHSSGGHHKRSRGSSSNRSSSSRSRRVKYSSSSNKGSVVRNYRKTSTTEKITTPSEKLTSSPTTEKLN